MRRGLATYEPGSMEGWLSRITTNAFLDEVRKRKRRPLDVVAELPEPCHRRRRRSRGGPGPHDACPTDVQDALRGLPEEYRAADRAVRRPRLRLRRDRPAARRPDRHRPQPHPSRPGPAAQGAGMSDDRTLPPTPSTRTRCSVGLPRRRPRSGRSAEAVAGAPRGLPPCAADLEQLQLVRRGRAHAAVRRAAVRLLRAHAPPRSPPVAAPRRERFGCRRDRRHRRHGRRAGRSSVVVSWRADEVRPAASSLAAALASLDGAPGQAEPLAVAARRPAAVARPLPVPRAGRARRPALRGLRRRRTGASGSPGADAVARRRAAATAAPVTDVVAVDGEGWMVRVGSGRPSPSSSAATVSTRWSVRRARTSPAGAAALPEDQDGRVDRSIACARAGRSLLEAFGVGD